MVIHKDFTVSADELQWVDRDDLVEVIPGLRYQTPHHFYEHTLCVFLNGVRVERNNDDGFFIVDDHTFEMRESLPLPRFRITVFYLKKET